MTARRGRLILWAAALALGSGCASSPWTTSNSSKSGPTASTPASAAGAVAGEGQAAASPAKAPTAGQTAAQVDPRAVDALVAEVAASEGLEPAVRDQLARDLRQTDPTLWSAFVQQFRASIAYRRQREQREKAAAAEALAQTGPRVRETQGTDAASGRLAGGAAGRETRLPRTPPTQPTADDPPEPAARPAGFERLLGEETSDKTSGVPEIGSFAKRATHEANAVPESGPVARRPGRSPGSEGREGPVGPVETASREAPPKNRNANSPSTPADPRDPFGRPVGPARDNATPESWRGALAASIAALETELRDAPPSAGTVDLQARLRMMHLLADRRDEALRPISAAPPAVQEFWSEELYGLATWLDSQRLSDASRRAGESKPALAAAVQRLGDLSPLVVRNLAFITEVQSYGAYKPFAKNEFTPGQELLLYAEVENFRSEDTPKGFHTVLQASYQVFDARGQRVASQELNAVEEHCRNLRHDFFLAYRLSLPKRIYPGKHTLQLTLVDQKSQKIGQASIDFEVRDNGQ